METELSCSQSATTVGGEVLLKAMNVTGQNFYSHHAKTYLSQNCYVEWQLRVAPNIVAPKLWSSNTSYSGWIILHVGTKADYTNIILIVLAWDTGLQCM